MRKNQVFCDALGKKCDFVTMRTQIDRLNSVTVVKKLFVRCPRCGRLAVLVSDIDSDVS